MFFRISTYQSRGDNSKSWEVLLWGCFPHFPGRAPLQAVYIKSHNHDLSNMHPCHIFWKDLVNVGFWLKNCQKLWKIPRALLRHSTAKSADIISTEFAATLGPCTRGSNIPMSRFQIRDIPICRDSGRENTLCVYPNFSNPNIPFFVVNIQNSMRQYPLFLGNDSDPPGTTWIRGYSI